MNARHICWFLLVVVPGVFAGELPDPKLTPGAINPDVTQENIQQTICVKGYSTSVRPPWKYTNQLKKQQIQAYGYQDVNLHKYEGDHLIAISIGGAPYDVRNYWPEPRDSEWGADKKDILEFVLYKMVCKNEITLMDAQRAIAGNWIAAWEKYVPSHPSYRFDKRDD